VLAAPDPLLLAVDGNSLLHRAHHAWRNSELRDADGDPIWALRGLIGFVARAAARLTPDAVVIGFDCTRESVRKTAYPAYKAQRADKPAELVAQLAQAPDLFTRAGITVVVATGFEADDVLASAASLARRGGWRAALMTSDRDSFALIDGRTSVLRVLNGGIDDSPMITPEKLLAVCGVRPDQYRDYAALRGDSSDNLPGAHGIGGKTAARLLAAFDTLDAVFAALDSGSRSRVEDVVGEPATARLHGTDTRALVARNQQLMRMRDDLPLPALTAMAVPVDGDRLRTAFRARQIHLASSVWALVGEPPPAWHPAAPPPPFEPLTVDLGLPDEAVEGPLRGRFPRQSRSRPPAVVGGTRRRSRSVVIPGQLALF
jgi:DNA polymerase-1